MIEKEEIEDPALEPAEKGRVSSSNDEPVERPTSYSSALPDNEAFAGRAVGGNRGGGGGGNADAASAATGAAASRITSRTGSVLSRVRSSRRQFGHALGHQKTGSDVIVDFDGQDDPYRPLNWTSRKKFITLILYATTALGGAFNSAIFASDTDAVADAYHVSTEVSTLGTSMTLLGFAFGPLLWGPLSELYGRKWVVLGPYFIAACFAFGCGASKDIQSILITRFFQGLFSASVITNTGGVLSDIYAPKQRGTALVLYSLAVVGGPLCSPIVGSAIVNSYLGWRWTMYIVGIFQMSTAAVAILFVEETYPPALLARKAQQLRHETGNWALHAKHEEWNPTLGDIAQKYLVRPFQFLVNPTCFLMSLYASFVYGLIYGSLSAIPIVFEGERGWTPVLASLPFLALLLGCILGLLANIANTRLYVDAMDRNNGRPVPEARLYPMMGGSFLLAAGLFLFAWTAGLQVNWVVPCLGILLIGAGFFPIFQASLNYIIDTFLPMAASAIATVTFMRSLFAAAFPLFIGPMLRNLGVPWGLSLLGFVAVAMLPVPFLFFVFGARIRARGKHSQVYE